MRDGPIGQPLSRWSGARRCLFDLLWILQDFAGVRSLIRPRSGRRNFWVHFYGRVAAVGVFWVHFYRALRTFLRYKHLNLYLYSGPAVNQGVITTPPAQSVLITPWVNLTIREMLVFDSVYGKRGRTAGKAEKGGSTMKPSRPD